jgi:hypothetical protein
MEEGSRVFHFVRDKNGYSGSCYVASHGVDSY